jgi:hypothetical protein
VINLSSKWRCAAQNTGLNQLTFNDGRDCHGELDTIKSGGANMSYPDLDVVPDVLALNCVDSTQISFECVKMKINQTISIVCKIGFPFHFDVTIHWD